VQEQFFLLNSNITFSKAVRKSELEVTSGLSSYFPVLWNTELKFLIGCFFFLSRSLKNTVLGLSKLQVGVRSAADAHWRCFMLFGCSFCTTTKNLVSNKYEMLLR